jgi:hypothetical protein
MDLESAIQSAQIVSIQSVFTEKLKLLVQGDAVLGTII